MESVQLVPRTALEQVELWGLALMLWTSAFPPALSMQASAREASSLEAGKVACLDPGTCPVSAEITQHNRGPRSPSPQHTTQDEGKKERLVSGFISPLPGVSVPPWVELRAGTCTGYDTCKHGTTHSLLILSSCVQHWAPGQAGVQQTV